MSGDNHDLFLVDLTGDDRFWVGRDPTQRLHLGSDEHAVIWVPPGTSMSAASRRWFPIPIPNEPHSNRHQRRKEEAEDRRKPSKAKPNKFRHHDHLRGPRGY